MTALHVERTAAPILIQDAGRVGLAEIAVPTSGAFDRGSARLAGRLVGNPSDAACLEVTMGAAVLRTDATVTVVVTGAAVDLQVAERSVAVNEVVSWPAGTRLQLGRVSSGVRSYIAVRGGLAVDPVLGSASSDVLSGLGPAPLRTGDRVGLAFGPADLPLLSHAPGPVLHRELLRIRLGPRADWFEPAAREALCSAAFEVAADSNRVGMRLRGPVLRRSVAAELPSEPLQRGGLQVPPNGQPIIMGPDHPTTGGYPVIAAVLSDDWDALAHLRPGDIVRFRAADG